MYKYIEQAEQSSIPLHRHCVVCATPIFTFEQFCGPECENAFKRVESRRKYMMLLPILIIFLFFLLIFIIGHH